MRDAECKDAECKGAEPMSEALWILVANCPSLGEARAIGRSLIEEGLARSANISAEMETLYPWDGVLVEDRERQLILKLPKSRVEAAAERIKTLHSFEVPAILAWPASYAEAGYKHYVLGER